MKKSKIGIIIFITILILITILLIGLTYAYYKTKVIGNPSEEASISLISENLQLTYADGSANVLINNIEPSDKVYSKIFTVTNDGDKTLKYSIYLIDIVNTFVRKNDIKYVLTCTTNGKLPCGEVTNETTFPSGISELSNATIEAKKTHIYTFEFMYKNININQSVDMGKQLSAKIQIFGENNNGIIIPFE